MSSVYQNSGILYFTSLDHFDRNTNIINESREIKNEIKKKKYVKFAYFARQTKTKTAVNDKTKRKKERRGKLKRKLNLESPLLGIN